MPTTAEEATGKVPLTPDCTEMRLTGVRQSGCVGVAVPVRVIELAELADVLTVDCGLSVLDSETVFEGVGEIDAEMLRIVAMLRPRKVMEDTAASASPESQREESSTPLEYPLEEINCVTFEYRKQAAGVPKVRSAPS